MYNVPTFKKKKTDEKEEEEEMVVNTNGKMSVKEKEIKKVKEAIICKKKSNYENVRIVNNLQYKCRQKKIFLM